MHLQYLRQLDWHLCVHDFEVSLNVFLPEERSEGLLGYSQDFWCHSPGLHGDSRFFWIHLCINV